MSEENPSKESVGYIAVIRVRGEVNIRSTIKDTMRMLRVPHKFNMCIHERTPSIMGMIKKSESYVTFGEVSKELADKFGIKNTVTMHPPRGGFEKKGIKVPFGVGGALGDRGDKISRLIEKMKK